jgi:hypothetical protein
MGRYLLTVIEKAGRHEFFTNHVLEATDVQMVKYHFHRTLKDHGYTDSPHGKHNLRRDGLGAEIHEIQEIDGLEWDVLENHTHRWTKV